MTLNLDARQRAMLEEMHVPFWWPEPPLAGELLATPGPEVATSASAPSAPQADWPAAHDAPAAVRAPAPPTPAPAPVPAPVARAVPAPPPAMRPGPASSAQAPSLWQLHPAQALFGTPPVPGGFLLVTEAVWPGEDPLADSAGAAGQLLANMLRAMRLHQPPRAWLAGLSRRPAGEAAEPLPWRELLQAQQPGLVLLMGRTAAREALGRDEPLGRLRGQVHDLHGVPAIVTYDASYLLRTQADKARAWADLCLALSQPGVALA